MLACASIAPGAQTNTVKYMATTQMLDAVFIERFEAYYTISGVGYMRVHMELF